MKNKNLRIALIIFLTTIAGSASFAADSVYHKYPVAVLVELKSEQSRVQALIKDKKYKELEEVKRDIVGENTAMVNDFNDNFDYCPVYFFVDTNVDLVLKKEFDGILLDTNLVPAGNININQASRDYVIVCYSYPTTQPHNQKVVSAASKYNYNSGEPIGRALVIMNDSLQQISYLSRLDYNGAFISKEDKKYAYSSKHFNIEYLPTADELDTRLKKRRNKHQVKR